MSTLPPSRAVRTASPLSGMTRLTQPLGVIAVAILTMLGLATAPASAQAQPSGSRVVVFGDSHTAGVNFMLYRDPRGCWMSHTSWPTRLAESLGLAGSPEFTDASCSGSSINSNGIHLSDQVRYAEERNAIGTRTEHILIQLGMNETWGGRGPVFDTLAPCAVNVIQGCDLDAVEQGRMIDPAAVTPEAFAERIKPVTDYLRYYAPGARISLVGYPWLTPAEGRAVCIDVLGIPGGVTQPRAESYVQYFNRLDLAQRGAAKNLGLGFIDLRAATEGHGPCSADPWINGIADPRSGILNGPWHGTPRGEAIMAGAIRQAIGA